MSISPFEEIVRAWCVSYGGRIPSNNRERTEAFIVLLGNLKDNGYNKEDLNSTRKKKIAEFCVNVNHYNRSKLRKWVGIVINDLENACSIYYEEIKIRTDVVTPAMAVKLDEMQRRAEEAKAFKSKSESNNNEENSDSSESEGLDDIDVDKTAGIDYGYPTTDPKIREAADEFLNEKIPDAIWDEALMAELGISKDE